MASNFGRWSESVTTTLAPLPSSRMAIAGERERGEQWDVRSAETPDGDDGREVLGALAHERGHSVACGHPELDAGRRQRRSDRSRSSP